MCRDPSKTKEGNQHLVASIAGFHWIIVAGYDRGDFLWVHQGQQLPPSSLHSIYVGLEALKILALAVFGFQKIDPSTFPGTKV